MRTVLAVIGCLLLTTCASAVVTPTPMPSIASATPGSTAGRPSPSPSIPPTTVLIPGTFRSVALPAPPGLPVAGPVFTDGTYAFGAFGDGHANYGYELLDLATGATRALPPLGPDDMGGPVGLTNGRIAYLSMFRSAAGQSYAYEIEDIVTGARKTIDSSDTPGHFTGEGAPIEAGATLVLGPHAVAYVHLSAQGPDLVGELRVGPIDGPTRVIARSTQPVHLLALTDTTLAYLVGAREDELHVYDIAAGRDRIAARGPLGFEVALAPGRLLYLIRTLDATPGRAILQDLATGNETVIAMGNCNTPALNDRYAAVRCYPADPGSRTTISVYELATAKMVQVARSSDTVDGVHLFAGTMVWFRYDGAVPPRVSVESLRYQ